eukprot:TRINITY_DN13907_c0_g1_i1.p1 TRINITY_DN13907_c0_g1~~TRINITY_DN13907_c0_g1_i1.p1  ORF type:complete len:314 (-),score=68.19 TRINITY_DN13907_c0_g1_i1:102-1043(-)
MAALVGPVKELSTNSAYIRLFGSSSKPESIYSALSKRDWQAMKDVLSFIRDNKIRRSDLVVAFGTELLKHKSSSLGDDVWVIYEQVVVAALDTGDYDLAKSYIDKLSRKFPKSHRVGRLKGLWLEASEKWNEAEKLYEKLVEHDPSDTIAAKRRICIQKAKGNINGAISLLNSYLNDFQADESAWHELSDLYLSQLTYKQAAFCFEELLLAAPNNYHYYCRYGEILYSMASENPSHYLGLARKYFCYSLKLNESNNMRSLFGVILVCQSARDRRVTLTKNDDKLNSWAKEKIIAVYKLNNSALQPIVSSALSL